MRLLFGDIFDILSSNLSSKEEEILLTERNQRMDEKVRKLSRNYIAHFPERSVENRWELIKSYEYSDLFQQMSIKEGVNMYKTANGFRFVGYYGKYRETLNLYPISDEQAEELQKIIYESDFDSSIIIDAEIAQYMWA